eukprot:3731265-Pleurochrysis_carterae.AAC.1
MAALPSSRAAVSMQAMAEFTGFGEDNDGAVPTAGCHTAAAAPTPTSAHYTAAVNHYDVTCRHGDGSWGGDDRKPCFWYAAMANAIFGEADRQELVLQGLAAESDLCLRNANSCTQWLCVVLALRARVIHGGVLPCTGSDSNASTHANKAN